MFRFERRPQTRANHAKLEPVYHFVAFGVLLANLGYAVQQLWQTQDFPRILQLWMAVTLLILFLALRVFTLAVQDRVIRLEERLRLERLLPADLRARIPELSTPQLVALRFASDGELVELVRSVFAEQLSDRRAIKERIRDWRPDYERC